MTKIDEVKEILNTLRVGFDFILLLTFIRLILSIKKHTKEIKDLQ